MSAYPEWLTALVDAARRLDAQTLARELPPPPASARKSAVLMLVADGPRGPEMVLIERAHDMRSHAGQVAFPGGAADPGDDGPAATALREAQEEIGLDPAGVEVVGELDHLSTITSGSYIVPFVGILAGRPDDLVANPDEVAHIIHVPLAELLAEEVYREEVWSFEEAERPIFFFELVGDTVWGATASMLRRFLALVLGVPPD